MMVKARTGTILKCYLCFRDLQISVYSLTSLWVLMSLLFRCNIANMTDLIWVKTDFKSDHLVVAFEGVFTP